MNNTIEVIDEQFEAGRRALRSYVVGFILSILLTLIPYFIVITHAFSAPTIIFVIMLFGVMQLLVQVIFFLHLSAKSKPRWNMLVFSFTLLVVAFLVAGSIWIMQNLNSNMHQASPQTTNEGYIPQ